MTDSMAIYAALDGVKAPRQARSHRAFIGALDALDALLRERPFPEVGVQDVADRAGLSITSLYARFDGKATLLMALHERVIMIGLSRLDDELASLSPAAPASDLVAAVAAGAVRFADDYAHVFRAVIASADVGTHERVAAFVRAGSQRVADSLLPRLPPRHAATDADIDFAWRSMFAVIQQRSFLCDAEPSRHPLTSAALSARLARSFLADLGRRDADR